MIVSHEHEFIFIRTRKTASTTVELFLGPLVGEDGVVTPLLHHPEHVDHPAANYAGPWNPWGELRRKRLVGLQRAWRDWWAGRRYYDHMQAKLVRDRIGRRRFDRYFKFCFDRDPWDKTISLYYWRRQEKQLTCDFDEFVRNHTLASDWNRYSIGGQPAMDFIGAYERLEEDLARALAQVGIDVPVDLGWAKSGIRASGSDPTALYTPELDRIVAATYSREIEHFGYRSPLLVDR